MPKRNLTPITLPVEKPDCCAACPLCGLIPKCQRPKGSKETHVCLATSEALGGRGIKVKASERDSHHPLRRPCDGKWEAWIRFPKRQFMLNSDFYLMYRVPYEQTQQMIIRFHNRKNDEE